MNRSQAIRAAVLEASPAAPGELPPVAERDELRLLGEAARDGSVSAMRALLLEHRRDSGDAPPCDHTSLIDGLRRRRSPGRTA